ncbi:hypothetical protein SAMN04487820_11566 [Actinopolyspora mzabensis]|uniref:DUF1326 domain-containing protein n=1 Tax=Actinopolyspora mzabensis TaxID=995066 RepID=A0A1G9FIR6_ACTMZ|nr:DUF1326 domain-containing protein [Actinopolyspora mzabensis]SDK88290.1 hypothetical protein SAMN04487820_11566 [Actinopolyspora mzabensis]
MTTATMQNWHLKGVWFDACKCAIPCPCSFAQPPTYGDCSGILLWHVNEGNFGDTPLDELNVTMLGSFTGNPWAGTHTDPYAAVFIDERGDEDQRQALQRIFGGEAGGWPAEFGAMFGPEILGMEFSPIEASFEENFARWSVRVPGRAEAEVEALTGPTAAEGSRVEVHNLPGAEVGPAQPPAVWGKAVSDQADAFGFQWNRSGYSSKLIPFEWSGPDAK